MRVLVTAAMLFVAAPLTAQANDAIAARITQELNEKGPLGYIGQICDRLNGVPVWGGVRSAQQTNARELTGSGVKLNCGSDGRVANGELKSGFQGPLPQGTAFTMRQKDVWKTLKKKGLKKEIEKGKADGGRFVRLNRKTPVTWKWSDPKGKQGVSVILLNQ
jgi:hypothetical protein